MMMMMMMKCRNSPRFRACLQNMSWQDWRPKPVFTEDGSGGRPRLY